MTRVLPLLMAFMSAGASVMYALSGNYRLAVYWAAAMALTLSVTL